MSEETPTAAAETTVPEAAQVPPTPASPQKPGMIGGMIGGAVVLGVLILAGLYLWGATIEKNRLMDASSDAPLEESGEPGLPTPPGLPGEMMDSEPEASEE